MKKTKLKTLILISVILTLSITLSGCGRGNEVSASKDYIYRYEELAASREFQHNTNLLVAGDDVYMYGTIWDDHYINSELLIIRLTDEGEAAERTSIRIPGGTHYGSMTGSSDGRIFAVKTVYPDFGGGFGYDEIMPLPADMDDISYPELFDDGEAWDEQLYRLEDEIPVLENNEAEVEEWDIEEEGDIEEELSEVSERSIRSQRVRNVEAVEIASPDFGTVNFFQTEQYYLVEIGMNGNELMSINLSENLELNSMEYFYIGQVYGLAGNRIIVSAMDKFAVYDTQLNYLGLLDFEIDGMGWNYQFLRLNDGRTIMYYYSDNTIIFREFDPLTGTFGNEYTMEGNIWAYTIHAGGGFDLFLTDYSDLYGYNLGEEPVKLMNYVDSDLNTYSITNILAFDVNNFWGMVYDSVEHRNIFARFTKVPPEEVADRIGITLGGSFIDWQIRNHVVSFNRSNDTYRISLIDYGSMYNTNDDWNAGVTRLNSDIVSGRAPDILAVTSDLPIQSYMSKGLFADLLPFIDKDDELSIADLMPNVVEAYSMNGKMYRLVPHYYVGTAFAKTSLVGTRTGWTINEAKALLSQMPPETRLFDEMMTRSQILYNAMIYGGDQFIDWERGECHFNGDAFITLLEFMKEFPDEIDYSIYDRHDFWMEWESNHRRDRVLLMVGFLGNMRDYNRIAKGQFGADVTMIGFPAESGNGAALITYQSFAMSDRSRSKEGAWEFLRYYLSGEFQESLQHMLPISRKAFDNLALEAMQKPYYIDENGLRVEYDDIYYVDNQEVILEPMTKAELDRVVDYILTVNTHGEFNEDLVNIINEEAASFFAGQKNVREVVDIIQSRAQIYVNESQ